MPRLQTALKKAVEAGLAEASPELMTGAEIAINLSDDARIRIVNMKWRGVDKATNVLAFPAVPIERLGRSKMVGDIILSYETIVCEAECEGKTAYDHALHLVIHGLLHLLGYDHDTAVRAQVMEAIEVRSLARLGIADPYGVLAASEVDNER